MEPNIRVAIYDLAGTLLNSGKEGFRRLGVLAERNGLSFSEEVRCRLREYWGLSPIKLITVGFDIAEDLAREIHRQWVEWDAREPIPLVDGIEERLGKNLENGVVNFVFTSRHTQSAFSVVKRFGIVHLFEDVIGIEGGVCLDENNELYIKPTGFEKPDPRSLDNLLQFIEENYGHSRQNIAYIGDEIFDAQCGMGAGLCTFGVLSGLRTFEELCDAGILESFIFPTASHVSF